jgi:hypothetical protein
MHSIFSEVEKHDYFPAETKMSKPDRNALTEIIRMGHVK